MSLITPLIGYARIRHLLPTLLQPHGASTLSSLNPQPPPAAPAHRLRAATWINGRTALGACLVLLAVLAGALFLDRSQRLVTVVTTITGFDERWVPDANFAVTIAETYRTDGGGNLVHTAEQKLDVDTTVSTVLAAVFALTVFASGWFALPFALAAFQTVILHGAEEQGLPAQKGVGSTVTDHLLLPAIPIPRGKKRPITYVGQVVVEAYGMFAGGRIETEVPRTPSIELKGPSSIQSAMGQGVVRGHYHAEVAKVGDLLGPVVYTWTSDGEVHGSGAEVTVLFDTPASGKTHLRHVSVTVTDADGIQVGDAREVRISTVSHQGPGGGHGGQGGGSGSNNPPSEP